MLEEKVAKEIGLESPLLLLSLSFGIPGSLLAAFSFDMLILALFLWVWVAGSEVLSFGLWKGDISSLLMSGCP